MFYSPKVYWKDKWVLFSAIFGLFFEILMGVYAFLYIRPTEDLVFLHYNVVFGVDLIGVWWKMLFDPFVGICLFFFNFLLSWYIYSEDKVLARMLTVLAALFNLFLFVAFYLIIGLNS